MRIKSRALENCEKCPDRVKHFHWNNVQSINQPCRPCYRVVRRRRFNCPARQFCPWSRIQHLKFHRSRCETKYSKNFELKLFTGRRKKEQRHLLWFSFNVQCALECRVQCATYEWCKNTLPEDVVNQSMHWLTCYDAYKISTPVHRIFRPVPVFNKEFRGSERWRMFSIHFSTRTTIFRD